MFPHNQKCFVYLAFHFACNTMVLKPTCICPVTGKELNCFFVVYSPKVFDHDKANKFMNDIQHSPHILITDEYGENRNHKHRNYFFYSKQRDGWNIARAYKLRKPEWTAKLVTSPNNIVTYMTKEVNTSYQLPSNQIRSGGGWRASARHHRRGPPLGGGGVARGRRPTSPAAATGS